MYAKYKSTHPIPHHLVQHTELHTNANMYGTYEQNSAYLVEENNNKSHLHQISVQYTLHQFITHCLTMEDPIRRELA